MLCLSYFLKNPTQSHPRRFVSPRHKIVSVRTGVSDVCCFLCTAVDSVQSNRHCTVYYFFGGFSDRRGQPLPGGRCEAQRELTEGEPTFWPDRLVAALCSTALLAPCTPAQGCRLQRVQRHTSAGFLLLFSILFLFPHALARRWSILHSLFALASFRFRYALRGPFGFISPLSLSPTNTDNRTQHAHSFAVIAKRTDVLEQGSSLFFVLFSDAHEACGTPSACDARPWLPQVFTAETDCPCCVVLAFRWIQAATQKRKGVASVLPGSLNASFFL